MEESIMKTKDLDRHLLFFTTDRQLLKVCNLNPYYRHTVCDDMFFKRRLEHFYPSVLASKGDLTYRELFLQTVYYIDKLKREYKYQYRYGNPNRQYEIFKQPVKYFKESEKLLLLAGIRKEWALVEDRLKAGDNINMLDGQLLIAAAGNDEVDKVKYLVERGADIHASNDMALASAASTGRFENVKYLLFKGAAITNAALSWAQKHPEIYQYLIDWQAGKFR